MPPQNSRRLPRSLRIGVAQRGRILQETLVPPGGTVKLGSDPRTATVLVEPGVVPRRGHTLLTNRPGAAELRLRPGMTGRVSRGDVIADLSKLVDGRGRVALGVRDRGKVRIGDTTLLFQFVETPPLPQAAHWSKRLGAEADAVWTATLLLSAVFHAAAVVWISTQPPPPVDVWQAKADRITVWVDHLQPEVAKELAQELIEGPETEDAVAEADEPDEQTKPDEPDQADEPEPGEGAGGGEPESDEPPPRTRQELEAEVSGRGVLAIIGTAGTSSVVGAVDDLLDDPGGLAPDVAAAVALAPRARGREQIGLKDGGVGTDAVVGGDGISVDGPGGGEGGRVQKRAVEPIAKEPEGGVAEVDPSADGVDLLRAEIKKNVRSFKACYERILKQDDPDLGGTIRLSWSVETNGRVSGARILSDNTGSAALQACVVKRLRALRFSGRDEAVEIESYPINFSAQ